jgi:murein DD-endopeptidase MepM/ murein hydrolase activator NlpD
MKADWFKNKLQDIIRKLLKDYRLSIYDNSNLTEVYTSTVSKLSIWVILLFISLVSVSITLILLFYTPLKRSIPGYPSRHMSEMIQYNSVMVDSLQDEINKRDNYLDKIQKVIMGGVVEDTVSNTEKKNDKIEMKPMSNDSIFETLVEPVGYKSSQYRKEPEEMNLSKIKFFTPVKGTVTNKFKASPGHFGTDIVAPKNSQIAATLDGTVIFAEWSISTGYVVQIQHDNNLISVYKHNSDVKVKQGERVKAGEIISIMGNEGELSNGPHLHFELWHDGKPLNAELYMKF